MDNTYNIDFIARCIAGHNKAEIKSIITELENVQKQVGGVSLVEITQEDYDALADKDPSTIYLVSNGNKITLYIGGAEVNEIKGIKVNNITINPDSNKVFNITVPTTAADVSALPDTTKYAAALSLTINSSTFVMTGQLKDQNGDNLGTAQTIDLPLESVVVGGSYNSQTKKVVLTLQNGNTIEFSVADLVSGLQTELSMSNKLNPAFIEYDSSHRAVSDVEKSTWNGKQSALSTTQLDAVNSGIDRAKVEQIETNKNNISKDEAALVELVDESAKNLINVGIPRTETLTDVVFTINSDGTVDATTTATTAAERILWIYNNKTKMPLGIEAGKTYCFYCNSGTNDFGIDVWNSTNGTSWSSHFAVKVGTYLVVTIPANSVGLSIRLLVPSGTTLDDVRAYPMVCTKAAWDISHEYQPYRPSYQELYEMVKALQANQ